MKAYRTAGLRNPTALLLSLLFLSGCSDSGTEVKDELAPLVGAWRAQALVMTSREEPETSVDLVDEGGVFTLSILATGDYTASLVIYGQPNTEAGKVTVSGDQITITPTTPPGPPVTGRWRIEGGILYLDGSTEFDFDLDGIRETADIHMELYPIDL